MNTLAFSSSLLLMVKKVLILIQKDMPMQMISSLKMAFDQPAARHQLQKFDQ